MKRDSSKSSNLGHYRIYRSGNCYNVQWCKCNRDQKEHDKIRLFYWIHQASAGDMKKTLNIRENQICFIVDNSSVYWSDDTMKYLKETNWSWLFLPQYTPEFIPVELFFCHLKRLVLSRKPQNMINLGNMSSRIFIADLIGSIDQITIVKTWMHFLLKLKESINELSTIFKLLHKVEKNLTSSVLK